MKKLPPVVCLLFVLSTCSGANGIGQMMVDAGEVLLDAGNGNAQTGPARVLTAETDASRLEGAIVRVTAATSLVLGPIVIKNLQATRASSSVSPVAWISPEAVACSATVMPVQVELFGTAMNNYFVRAGERLCVDLTFGGGTVAWSGYRPY